ncbi:biopolymer transporter ExbD [Nitratireductor luteus]|uniref:biopolymer transporter ExbD n=1 Tax=Nitratireductor luteus TaxID=2976980 RepID=UPI002240D5C4|nr:biopolymer transporter ExbD [Nitratireductor luteus]
MRIELASARRRPLSLTPLIDIIFLLLLFFMLSSTFTRFSEVEISGGRAGAQASAQRPDVLIRIDGEAWRVNGLSLDADAAIEELTRLSENGAAKAVLLVRDGMNSQTLVGAVERIGRETRLDLTVAR